MRKRSTAGLAAAAAAFAVIAVLSSCLTLSAGMDLLASQAVSQGLMSKYQAAMLSSAAKAAAEATRKLTPEEEYYVGRAVAARILSHYSPYDNPDLNAYLNRIGQGLALYSSKPEIFRGYRFLVLDSDEINAFATPGGHVLICRGLLRLARDEDELTAALAHEIAHVALGHGLSSVQGTRLAKIGSDFAIGAGMASGGDVAAFTTAFGDSIAELASELILSGYSQSFELAADQEASRMLSAAGYDSMAVSRLIARLPGKSSGLKAGFASTHPDPSLRLEALSSGSQPGRSMLVRKQKPEVTVEGKPLDPAVDTVVPVALLRAERFTSARVLF